MSRTRVAVFSAVYPAVLPYLRPWYRSVLAQADTRFQLVIAAHGLTRRRAQEAVGQEITATWIDADPAHSGRMVRQAGLSHAVNISDVIVLVDADDILEPDRVERARQFAESYDLSGCGMSLIDETGESLGQRFAPEPMVDLASLISQQNVFGLSNTVYRSSLLRRLLPIPDECVLVDWYLATRAREAGAVLGFDQQLAMRYRQHDANIARVLPPFTIKQLHQATNLVTAHVRLLQASDFLSPSSRAEVAYYDQRLTAFRIAINDGDRSAAYLTRLNRKPGPFLWWAFVAHPDLEDLWKH